MLFCPFGVVPQVNPLLLQLPTVQTSFDSMGCDPNFEPLIGRLFLSPCHLWLEDDRLKASTVLLQPSSSMIQKTRARVGLPTSIHAHLPLFLLRLKLLPQPPQATHHPWRRLHKPPLLPALEVKTRITAPLFLHLYFAYTAVLPVHCPVHLPLWTFHSHPCFLSITSSASGLTRSLLREWCEAAVGFPI